MNTTLKGDIFEDKVYEIIENLVKNNKLEVNSQFCEIFRKKAYATTLKDRKVSFDISIEVKMPNSDRYSFIYLIECKNYSKPVPINQIKKFKADIDDISNYNVKPLMISNSSFEGGTRKFAEEFNINLIEVLTDDGYNISWNNSYSVKNSDFIQALEKELLSEFEDKIEGIQYYSKENIKAIANNFLNNFNPEIITNYTSIDYSEFLIYLKTDFDIEVSYKTLEDSISGNINLESKIITINDTIKDSNKISFVLCHEVGHYILHKNIKINNNLYKLYEDSEYNFRLGRYELKNPKNWIEWQANYFASCLILPDSSVQFRLAEKQIQMGINRRIGKIFIDEMTKNTLDYQQIILHLSGYFNCSRQSIEIKLKELNLITKT